VLTFKRKRDAERTRAQLSVDGFDVSAPIKGGLFAPSALEVRLPSKAEYPVVKEDVKKMRALADHYGAIYDGFGAEVV
jgi:Regulator of ribonuclease activity B